MEMRGGTVGRMRRDRDNNGTFVPQDDLVCCPVEGGAAGPPLLPPPDALPGREPVPQHQRRRTHTEEDR